MLKQYTLFQKYSTDVEDFSHRLFPPFSGNLQYLNILRHDDPTELNKHDVPLL